MLTPSVLNATVTRRVDVTPELVIFGIKPDSGVQDFSPGQYVALGLLGAAPRPASFPPETEPVPPDRLVKRAYSICSSPSQLGELEFYIGILPLGALTSRLVSTKPGDRVYVAPKITGTFTLHGIPPEANLVFVALGTGIAPYISMLRTPKTWTPNRRITLLHSARVSADLAYRAELEALAKERSLFKYIPTVTRDDSGWTGARGRIQSLIETGHFTPDPSSEHVFLCGNSQAIADIEKILMARGFVLHTKKIAGNIHEEKYD